MKTWRTKSRSVHRKCRKRKGLRYIKRIYWYIENNDNADDFYAVGVVVDNDGDGDDDDGNDDDEVDGGEGDGWWWW